MATSSSTRPQAVTTPHPGARYSSLLMVSRYTQTVTSQTSGSFATSASPFGWPAVTASHNRWRRHWNSAQQGFRSAPPLPTARSPGSTPTSNVGYSSSPARARPRSTRTRSRRLPDSPSRWSSWKIRFRTLSSSRSAPGCATLATSAPPTRRTTAGSATDARRSRSRTTSTRAVPKKAPWVESACATPCWPISASTRSRTTAKSRAPWSPQATR